VQFRNALRTAPASSVALTGLEAALYHTKRYEDALATLRARWRIRGGPELEEAMDRGYAEAGYQGAMRRAADTLAERWPAEYTNPSALATTYLRAGQKEQVLEWLERAYEVHDPNLPSIGGHPDYDKLRDHPRFQALLRKMNLPM